MLDLLTADYTFVDERLAQHYGIPNIYGSRFRRVPVTEDARRGLLGQGSILALTSKAERTSPVVRGKWILENLLGLAVPPPPPNVPPLAEQEAGAKPKTMREQMALHRASPVCAACHKTLDPIGFVMENFNAVGAWRDDDQGNPIDATAELPDGTQVDGVVEYREALLEPAGSLYYGGDQEAADLRTGPRAGFPRYARGPADRPQDRPWKLQAFGFDPGSDSLDAVPQQYGVARLRRMTPGGGIGAGNQELDAGK